MPVHRLSDMTWEEVRDTDRRNAVAILPVGAVEAHGPHLPLGTDVIIAEAMAKAGAQKLANDGLTVLILPPIWYTSAAFADAFPGTIGVGADTVRKLIHEIGAALLAQGVSTLAIANAHLDPEHIAALREATHAGPDGLRIVLLDLTRPSVARRLTSEFQTGACHAGQFEGSVVLAESPSLVRTNLAAGLDANPVSLSEAIREGKTTFAEAGGPRAYFGWPAQATAEEGRNTVRLLGELLAEAVVAGEEAKV